MGPFTIENASDFHEKRTSFKMLFRVEHLKTGPRRISVDSQSEGFRKRERYGTFVDDPCGVFWSFPTTLFKSNHFLLNLKEAKYFHPHLRFRFVFTCSHYCVSFENAHFPMRFHSRTPEKADGSDGMSRLFRRCFQKPPFSAVHTRNEAFSKDSTF